MNIEDIKIGDVYYIDNMSELKGLGRVVYANLSSASVTCELIKCFEFMGQTEILTLGERVGGRNGNTIGWRIDSGNRRYYPVEDYAPDKFYWNCHLSTLKPYSKKGNSL